MNDTAKSTGNDPAEQAVAEAVGEAMYARDTCGQALGIALKEIRPGYARVEMRVRDDMLNGHGTAHGGIIFTLGDTAFGYSCNSYNTVTVARHCSIDFLKPGRAGEMLTATAQHFHQQGRTGVYDIAITGEDGRMVALFRGYSHRLEGEVAPLAEAAKE